MLIRYALGVNRAATASKLTNCIREILTGASYTCRRWPEKPTIGEWRSAIASLPLDRPILKGRMLARPR